jgi:hypothetical protein
LYVVFGELCNVKSSSHVEQNTRYTVKIHCKKKLTIFPFLAGMLLTKLPLAGNTCN